MASQIVQVADVHVVEDVSDAVLPRGVIGTCGDAAVSLQSQVALDAGRRGPCASDARMLAVVLGSAVVQRTLGLCEPVGRTASLTAGVARSGEGGGG